MRAAFGAFLAILSASASLAVDDSPARLVLELNDVSPSDDGCRVTLMVTNQLAQPVERVTFEMALFDGAGAINRLVTIEFKGLSVQKSKVQQFDLHAIACSNLSRILVNDGACSGGAIAPQTCLAALDVRNRTAVAFGL